MVGNFYFGRQEFYANQLSDVQSSSSSSTPYQARWYNRDGYLEDPWISIDDHADAVNLGTIVYGENSFGGTHASAVLPLHNGADVYIRKEGLASMPDFLDLVAIGAFVHPH